MKTLNIQISDIEYNELGIKGDLLSFKELLEILAQKISTQKLQKSLELAEKLGLSTMSIEEINKEINGVRNAKGNS